MSSKITVLFVEPPHLTPSQPHQEQPTPEILKNALPPPQQNRLVLQKSQLAYPIGPMLARVIHCCGGAGHLAKCQLSTSSEAQDGGGGCGAVMVIGQYNKKSGGGGTI